jgi:enoyl-CoA hydratase/carnithine racemase
VKSFGSPENTSCSLILFKSDTVVDDTRYFIVPKVSNDVPLAMDLLLYQLLRSCYKPQIAFLDGLVFGLGASIALNCPIRIATNSSIFQAASQEEACTNYTINPGLFYSLSNLDDNLGPFLALTGYKVKGKDLWHAGLSTIYMPYERLSSLELHLHNLVNYDSSSLRQLLLSVCSDPGFFSLKAYLPIINRCFGGSSVEDIIESLKQDNSSFSQTCVERILSYPPLFIKLTHKLLQTCAGHSPIDCLRIAHLLNQNKKKILTNFSPPTTLKEVSRELLESLVPADPADYSSVDFLKERVPQTSLKREEWELWDVARHYNGKLDILPGKTAFFQNWGDFEG